MPKKTAPRLGTAYGWTLGEGPWNTDMDANLKLIDALLGGGSVISNTQTSPGAGGGGSSYTGIGPADQDVLSSSNYTWKGNLLTASQNSFVTSIDARVYVQTASSVTFQATIAAASGGKITGTPVFSATVTPSTTGWQTVTFNFNTPVPVTSGTQYAVMIGVVGKGTTYATPVSIPTGSWPSNPWFTGGVLCRCAADPVAVNTAYDTNSGSTSATIFRLNGNTSGGSVAEGDAYIVPENATGAWAGKTNQIAVYVDGAWLYIVPKRGLRIEVQSAGGFMWFNGTAWTAEPSGGGGSGGIPDAPADGSLYGRKDSAWAKVPSGLADAPADGSLYGRKDSAWVPVPSGSSGALSNRNVIVDGNFDFWSLDTSFNVNTAMYTADVWFAHPGSFGVATVSRVARDLGPLTSGMTSPSKYKLRFQQTTQPTVTAPPALSQRIEDVSTFNGRSVTVSCFLSAAAATKVTGIQVIQNFGTGGSPSANVTTTKTVTWNVDTTEKRFSARVDIPSVAGKVLGTDGNNYVQIGLLFPNNQNFTIDVSQFQVEECDPNASNDLTGNGGAPTPFEYRGMALECERVRRLYQRLSAEYNAYAGASGWGYSRTISISEMRVKPSVSAVYSNQNNVASSSVNSRGPSSINIVASATNVGAFYCGYAITCDARL